MKAGFGSWAEISVLPDDTRRLLWYGNMLADGMTVNWETGEVRAPKRG